MEADRFDRLTKAAARGLSRRRLLAGLAGGIGAGARLGRSQAEEFVTREQCAQYDGATVLTRYSRCHVSVPSGGVSCGAFQYHWENICVRGGLIFGTIDAGCGPCLL